MGHGGRHGSRVDRKFTERLAALAKIAEIRLLDHLGLGEGKYVSIIRSLDESIFK